MSKKEIKAPVSQGDKNLIQQLDEWVQKKTRNMGLKKEKFYVIENMVMLLDSGMDVLSMLEALSSESNSVSMKSLIDEMHEAVAGGTPFWMAMKQAKIFPFYVISMIQMGEESGRLAENIKAINLQQRRDDDLRAKIRSAMMYPVLILFLSLFLGLGIAWFILPKLSVVFLQLNLELPLMTRMLMGFAGFLNKYGFVFVPIFILAIIFGFYFVFLNQKTNYIGKRFLLVLPGVNRLIKEIELSRLGYIMGNLLSAGVGVLEAFDSMAKATSFPSYRNFYHKMRQELEDGISFVDIFKKFKQSKKIIPPSVQRMIKAGAESGNLSDAFLNIGKAFETKTERTTKNLSIILEPILLVLVWSGVLLIALSVITPIYKLIGGFNAGLAGVS